MGRARGDDASKIRVFLGTFFLLGRHTYPGASHPRTRGRLFACISLPLIRHPYPAHLTQYQEANFSLVLPFLVGRHPYPVHLTQEQEADDWFGKFNEIAQGHANIYFTGELFAGVSVPVQLDYAIHWVPKLVDQLLQNAN